MKSLQQRKFRQKYNNLIAEGEKIGIEILQNSSYDIVDVFALESWLEKHKQLCLPISEKITVVDPIQMGKISALKTASPVLFVLNMKNQKIDFSIVNSGHAIFLDDVQDPGNVGTIIRLADWFGIPTVIRSQGSADFYNPKVIQATMGSFLNVNLYTSDFSEIINTPHKSVGAVMNGTRIYNFSWPEQTLLVMGNEGKGISGPVFQQLDQHVTIPGSANRLADSLNVGMATGIMCASLFANN